MQHCTRNSEPNNFVKVSAHSTGNFSADFEAEGALVRSIQDPPGRNPRWQSCHTAAAKFAFQDEMVSMKGDAGGLVGFAVVWRHRLFAVRTGSRICKDAEISD